jgi:hypothetical protein
LRACQTRNSLATITPKDKAIAFEGKAAHSAEQQLVVDAPAR